MRVRSSEIFYHSSQAINALGSITQVRLNKPPNWPSHSHASFQDQTNSSNSFRNVLDTSHISTNTHKNIGASAKTKIADTTVSIRTKWHSHITDIQERPVLSEHVNSTTYQTMSKEVQT